jgi:very-short-patch-repair endonuclease
MSQEVHSSPSEPPVQLGGVAGFVHTLAGYYANFLETDFKKARQPKRKFSLRDSKDNRIGIRTERYESFRTLIISKLTQATPANFTVKPGRHRAKVSVALRAGIGSSIEQIDTSDLLEHVHTIKEALPLDFRGAESDLELLNDSTRQSLHAALEQHVVEPVLSVLAPLFERHASSTVAIDQIISYSNEIVGLLYDEASEALPTALSDRVIGSNSETLESVLERMCHSGRIKGVLNKYFEHFGASDVFVELRELLASKPLMEGSEIYLNFGEIKTKNSNFPLYYIPVDVSAEEDGSIRLAFQTHLFVNKKAVDFIVGELARALNQTVPTPVSERIFYKEGDESYIDIANKTLHQILIGIQANGEVRLESEASMQAEGHDFRVTNDVSFSLCDKSDESIVNDYEALMTGLEGGGELLTEFTALLEGFITTNPLSIEKVIDQSWEDCPTPERLVFESPLPLAEEQRKILSALASKDGRFIAVEGPPGTGKSHTISAIAFQMILQGKSILILSDKTEALDVVENKLNGIIERIRGGELEYVNPILRLGKTDSNYANIIKKNSIDKLKTSVATFKAHRGEFFSKYDGLRNNLTNNVVESVDAANAIDIKKIKAFHDQEEKFFSDYPTFSEFTDDDETDFKDLSAFYSVVDCNRNFYAQYIPSNGDDEFLYLEFLRGSQELVASLDSGVAEQIRSHPKLDIDRAHELSSLANDIEDARIPLFGYLFSGKNLKRFAREIEAITGVAPPKPQEHLDTLRVLAKIKEILVAHLRTRGKLPNRVGEFFQIVSSDYSMDKESEEALLQFFNVDNERLKELGLPSSVTDLLGSGGTVQAMMEAYKDLKTAEAELGQSFEQLPDFDYLKQKSDYEDYNARILTNTIDERVVSYVQEKRADANTLKDIIRQKAKFPVDKFEGLKEAFPCMIAGLREFAEFIPLEAGLFDLVIIDEASQVSIAQALPAILRSKQMIVMGDRRQFGNVKTAQASIALNNAYFGEVVEAFNDAVARGDTALLTRCKKLNITNSVMDFFELVTNYSIQLRKHFRGYPEMISFSSRYFYENSLQVLKIRGKHISEVIEFVENDEPDALEIIAKANTWEADVIIARLEELLELEEPPSAAVITPHREQQIHIARQISDHPRYHEFVKQLKFACYTFDTCQGEERDVIFYSMVATRNNDRLNYIFPPDLHGVSEDDLDGKLKFQRLNVGFSRGKEKLVFVLSKPVEEYKGSIKQALMHYRNALETATDVPDDSEVDANSPMEAQVLEWLQATSFATSHVGELEIVPQFELGAYLKALDPGYTHPAYKVDFLLRLRTEESIKQIVVEYDGFEYHFSNRSQVDESNWQHYLNEADVERECVLESYGYKVLRINRFNLGKDPISTLDNRLKATFEEFDSIDDQDGVLQQMSDKTEMNIRGLAEGTHRKCTACEKVFPIDEFKDSSLKSGVGRKCRHCKQTATRKPRSRRYYR